MDADGRAIANYVLDRCRVNGRGVTNLALQKIIYFCHVWMLIKHKESLVRHEFEAWEFGPVLPYVYRDFKAHGDGEITTRAYSLNTENGQRELAKIDFPAEKKEFINLIIDFYGRLSAFDLVKMSHVNNGPWDQAWRHAGKVNPGMKINNQVIKDFYVQEQLLFPHDNGTLQ